MSGGEQGPEGAAGGDEQGTPQASRQVYEEVKGQYHIHDRANENLEKKAQNCMVASALVAALIVTAAMAHEAGRLVLESYVSYMAVVPVTGLLLAIVFCVFVDRVSSHPVTIVGKRLLCCDELDEKTYAALVQSEEGFYKSRIAEYARALVKLEETNKEKARRLRYAQISFASSIVLTLIVVVAAILS